MRYLEAGNIARVLYGRYKGNWYIEKLQAQYIGRMELKLCILSVGHTVVTTFPASSTTVTVAASPGTFLARLRAFCRFNASAIIARSLGHENRRIKLKLILCCFEWCLSVLLLEEPQSRNQDRLGDRYFKQMCVELVVYFPVNRKTKKLELKNVTKINSTMCNCRFDDDRPDRDVNKNRKEEEGEKRGGKGQ